MIEYPTDFPDSAISYVERALADAEGEFQAGRSYSPEDEQRPSVFFALQVFEAFVWQARAVARDQGWTATRLREVASACLERLIVSVYREKHPQRWNPALEPFRVAVHRELRRFSFWTQDYQDTLRELSDQVRPPGATAAVSPTVIDTIANLKARRANQLANYKRAKGISANRQVYENRESGIYKPQFYQWLSGTLPPTSATAINFERFLEESRRSS